MNTPDEQTGVLLSAYLDGELNEAESLDVQRLLAESPAARAQLDALRAVRDTLVDLPTHAAPESLLTNVAARVAAPRQRHLPNPYRWGLGLAAVLATFAVVWRFGGLTPAPEVGRPLAGRPPERVSPAPEDSLEALREAPQIAQADVRELDRLQQLGYVGDDAAEMEEFDAVFGGRAAAKPAPLGQSRGTAAEPPVEEAPAIAAATVTEPTPGAAGLVPTRPPAAPARRIAAAPPAPILGTTLRIEVNTADAAQYERLSTWAAGLELEARQTGDAFVYDSESVAGVLDVLATETTADVEVEMRFRGVDIAELRRAFEPPTISFVPPPPAEVKTARPQLPANVFATRHRRDVGRAETATTRDARSPRGRSAGAADAGTETLTPLSRAMLGRFAFDLTTGAPLVIERSLSPGPVPVLLEMKIRPPADGAAGRP